MKRLIDKLYDIRRVIDQWNALKFVVDRLGIRLVQNELHMEWTIGDNKKKKQKHKRFVRRLSYLVAMPCRAFI